MAINVFGQEILRGVSFFIERAPDNIAITGLIQEELDDGCKRPADLTGCKIDIYIYEEDLNGDVALLLSSAGSDPYITIIPGQNKDPNFLINVVNPKVQEAFPQNGEFPARMVITDSGNNPQTYWTGTAIVQ